MKPFNLEEAKAGKKVCTREGYDVEIFDFNLRQCQGDLLCIARKPTEDYVFFCDKHGRVYGLERSLNDLFMNDKNVGYVAIYNNVTTDDINERHSGMNIFKTEQECVSKCGHDIKFIATAKIEWEE